ncbi:hypothetical protein OWR29_11565 [Actinoplanes sp. Pm04-4]|uniref:WD40 repeat domain-containing protein n=1 Tax=Paractinoplanes pyxinae TaxID=2997416 RepID=A0ABT4AWM1_9ACTN|nr:hypothetical protein [Actinoplanes pyxinae]MCY1138636.1 hypothetical protein [Actinoplanes pyxinae]
MPAQRSLIRTALSVAVLGGATVVGFELATGSAAADQARELPIGSVADLVVDGAHQRIFISDPVGGKLITTSYTGEVLATSTGLPGVQDLILTDRLYAAVPGAGAIVAFDPATTATVATYAIGGAPQSLAAAGGKIWFGEDRRGLGSLDLSGSAPVVTRGAEFHGDLPAGAYWWHAPRLATTPGRPDIVAAVQTATTGAEFSLLDVSTDPPTPVARRAFSSFAHDLAFSADGTRLIVSAATVPTMALSSDDLSTIEEYSTTTFTSAVAVRSDGALALANSGGAGKAVALFTPGTTVAAKHFDLRPTEQTGTSVMFLQPAMAWEPGGDRLFGVADHHRRYSLQVLNDPAKVPVTIKLTVPATTQPDKGYLVRGTFSTRLVEGRPLVITRTDASGSRRVGPETADGAGFEFEDVQWSAGTVTYTVSIPGDDHLAAATATASVKAAVIPSTTLTLDRNGTSWAYGSTVTFTAKLGPTGPNRVVEIWADPSGSDQPNRLLRKLTVDGTGQADRLDQADPQHDPVGGLPRRREDPAQDRQVVRRHKASVSTQVTRHYKYAKIGSVPYYHFRRTAHPVFKATMNPHPGRKQYLQIDVYTRGKWILWGYFYVPLDASGRSSKELRTTHSTGVFYRERSDYQNGKSGDTANISTYGPYHYFTFTK